MNTNRKSTPDQTEVKALNTKRTASSKKKKENNSNSISFEPVTDCELMKIAKIQHGEKTEYALSVLNNAISPHFKEINDVYEWARVNVLTAIERFYIVMDYIKTENERLNQK